MTGDVGGGGETFALGDVGEAAMPQVSQRQVTGALLTDDRACRGAKGLEIVKAGEDATTGWRDRFKSFAPHAT